MAVKQLDSGIVEISIDRPKAMNAISSKVIQDLIANFKVACEDGATRVIIFRGAEKRGRDDVIKYRSPFGGADLGTLVDHENRRHVTIASAREHMQEGIDAIKKIRELCLRDGFSFENDALGRVLVIGWVDGPCLAGGIEFMYGISDLVYATPNSYFGMPEVIMCGMGGWMGPQLIREGMGSPLQVKEILLCLGDHEIKGNETGFIDASTMQTYGMLNGIIKPDDIEACVLEKAMLAASRDRMALTANLIIADKPVGEDVTEESTNLMIQLMMGDPWVETVCKFLDGKKK